MISPKRIETGNSNLARSYMLPSSRKIRPIGGAVGGTGVLYRRFCTNQVRSCEGKQYIRQFVLQAGPNAIL